MEILDWGNMRRSSNAPKSGGITAANKAGECKIISMTSRWRLKTRIFCFVIQNPKFQKKFCIVTITLKTNFKMYTQFKKMDHLFTKMLLLALISKKYVW